MHTRILLKSDDCLNAYVFICILSVVSVLRRVTFVHYVAYSNTNIYIKYIKYIVPRYTMIWKLVAKCLTDFQKHTNAG